MPQDCPRPLTGESFQATEWGDRTLLDSGSLPELRRGKGGWGDQIICLQLQASRLQGTVKRKELHRERMLAICRGSLLSLWQNSDQCAVCKEITWNQGKNYPEGLEETVPISPTGSVIMHIPTTQSGFMGHQVESSKESCFSRMVN